MTSLYGYYPLFDFSVFTSPNVQLQSRPCDAYSVTSSSSSSPFPTVMAYVVRHAPKMTYLIRLAGLQGLLADIQSAVTLFLPVEDSLPDVWVQSCDRETARKFIKYHFCVGVFPYTSLISSPFYQLRTTLKGEDIFVDCLDTPWVKLNGVPIQTFDIVCQNGVIHQINQPLTRSM